jgi:glycosyltransferase involved in cell wall biosynthesis
MLSILIPTYNYNAFPLVSELFEQSLKAKIEFEIICVDDASKSPLNKNNAKINSLKNCTFFSNKKNLGFSSNRNFLVSISKFDFLIFIDGDSEIINKNYINNYLNAISNEVDIIYGGRVHPNSVNNSKQKLRWKYGKFIESKTALERTKKEYISLMFNNTLITKNAFKKIKFDSSTNKYGHDDTLFAYKASLIRLKIEHIENAVMHADIDENLVFIKKTENALNNLLHLYELDKMSSSFVKILKLYKMLFRLKVHVFIAFLFTIFKPLLKKQLISKNPSILLFNLYKIGFFCYISINKN